MPGGASRGASRRASRGRQKASRGGEKASRGGRRRHASVMWTSREPTRGSAVHRRPDATAPPGCSVTPHAGVCGCTVPRDPGRLILVTVPLCLLLRRGVESWCGSEMHATNRLPHPLQLALAGGRTGLRAGRYQGVFASRSAFHRRCPDWHVRADAFVRAEHQLVQTLCRGQLRADCHPLGRDKRTCAIRTVGHAASLRFENRVPGGDVNPYESLPRLRGDGCSRAGRG